MEHGEEFARRHEHMITKPSVLVSTGITLGLSIRLLPSNNRIVHDWLIRLVFEVSLPPVHKVGSRPPLHLVQLFLGGPNLDSCINTIGSQRARSLQIPLIVDPLLHLGVSSNEIVKRFNVRLGPKDRKCKVMVLEVSAYSGQVDQRLDARSLEFFGVTDSRPLQNKRRTQRSATDDDLLASSEDFPGRITTIQGFGRHSGDTDSPAVLDDHLVHFGVALQVQVRVLGAGAVDIGMGRIASASCPIVRMDGNMANGYRTCIAVDPLQPVLCPMTTQIISIEPPTENLSAYPVFRSCKSSVTGIS